MATKKQKRAAALAKREKFLEDRRRSGLAALEKERARRKREYLKGWEKRHNETHNWKTRVPACPHCQAILEDAKRIEKELADSEVSPERRRLSLTRLFEREVSSEGVRYVCPFCKTSIEDNIQSLITHRSSGECDAALSVSRRDQLQAAGE